MYICVPRNHHLVPSSVQQQEGNQRPNTIDKPAEVDTISNISAFSLDRTQAQRLTSDNYFIGKNLQGKDTKEIADILSNNLNSCSNWLVDNKLSLHLGKTEAILFGSKRKLKKSNNFQVKCNDTTIKNVNNVKYLGLTLNDNMSGESIVHNILKKASCRLKFLYRYSNILNLKSRKTLCFALIQCHFDYSCSSWYSGINKDLKQRLQIMQNKMIRYIYNLNSWSHLVCSEFDNLNMLNVCDRVKQNKLT